MQEYRKVQRTGGSTLIISIPKEWARGRVKEGDRVLVTCDGDSLVITPPPRERPGVREAVIQYLPSNLDSTIRQIVAHYMRGYNVITISSAGVMANRDEIKDFVRRRLIGMEVVGETHNKIVFQNFLKWDDLPFPQTLSRIHLLVSSMCEDLLNCMEAPNEEILRDIIEREIEVDKFYLLGVRQLKAAIQSREAAAKLQVPSNIHCLGYRIVIKSIERVGDHVEKVSTNVLELSGSRDYLRLAKQLRKYGESVYYVYAKAIKSLFKESGQMAEEAIQEAVKTDSLRPELIKAALKSSPDVAMRIGSIVESFKRIADYSVDIAEITINLSVK